MGDRADFERIYIASMTGAIIAIRDVLRLESEGRTARLQADWPELWDRIDQAIGLIDLG